VTDTQTILEFMLWGMTVVGLFSCTVVVALLVRYGWLVLFPSKLRTWQGTEVPRAELQILYRKESK
jgi:hypothetical protein